MDSKRETLVKVLAPDLGLRAARMRVELLDDEEVQKSLVSALRLADRLDTGD